jgi:hypothetical protein
MQRMAAGHAGERMHHGGIGPLQRMRDGKQHQHKQPVRA